jgi:hypothetical protein
MINDHTMQRKLYHLIRVLSQYSAGMPAEDVPRLCYLMLMDIRFEHDTFVIDIPAEDGLHAITVTITSRIQAPEEL